jgi:hypothetical protein
MLKTLAYLYSKKIFIIDLNVPPVCSSYDSKTKNYMDISHARHIVVSHCTKAIFKNICMFFRTPY